MRPQQFWQIAVEAPFHQLLTYSSEIPLIRGQQVTVPMGRGNRLLKGVVMGQAALPPEEQQAKIKSISAVEPEYEPLPEKFIQWLEWLAQYYIYAPGMVMQLAFPPLMRKTRVKNSKRPPVVPQLAADIRPVLTLEQAAAISDIQKDQQFSVHLLFGVTGSGKTEVYLKLLEEVLNQGKQGLVLVPEISLTPQLIQRFARRFGDKIAAIHSHLTDRERTNQWWQMVSGEKQILIGARSALFCPLPNLGLIIVDEEHEPSFKQEEKLKYHGRDSAIMLARGLDIPIVLGSATPSLETWKNALDGRYRLHKLSQRVAERALPTVEVVDLRELRSVDSDSKKDKTNAAGLPFWMSPLLFERIEQTLLNKDQAALFLNRRGLAQLVLCPACGFTVECPNCDINLTLHAGSHLVCHYCDYHENLKKKCPDCKEGELEAIGLGTELIEKDLARLFPQARLARADRDEITNRSELEELVEKMENFEIDLLVGTQMIAKGLDFPKLKLVGLVLADVGFNLPDFRATERSFQLITQMSGRAGRHVQPGEQPGQVIIQTYNTTHESIQHAINHDFESFAKEELQTREALHYPPVGRLAGFRIQGAKAAQVQKISQLLAHRCLLLKNQNVSYQNIEVLGPAEAPLSRLKNQFRYHLLVKCPQAQLLNKFCRQVLGTEDWIESGVKISVDMDPMNLL